MTIKPTPGETGADAGQGESFNSILANYKKSDEADDAQDDDDSDESTGTGEDDVDADDEVDLDALKAQIKEAQAASINKDKLRRQARAETRELEEIAEAVVLNDPSQLTVIHGKNPGMADRIAKKHYGMDYKALVEYAQNEDRKQNAGAGEKATVDVRGELDKYMEEQRQAKEEERIEEYQDKFFASLKLPTKDPTLRKIVKTYGDFGTPQTLAQAEAFLEKAYAVVMGDDGEDDRTTSHTIANMPGARGSKGAGYGGSTNKGKMNSNLKAAAALLNIPLKTQ